MQDLVGERATAEEFLHMVIGVPQRRAMGFGAPMTAVELDAYISTMTEVDSRMFELD